MAPDNINLYIRKESVFFYILDWLSIKSLHYVIYLYQPALYTANFYESLLGFIFSSYTVIVKVIYK
jgi:hypothetical protein